jgi:hypothetical protein
MISFYFRGLILIVVMMRLKPLSSFAWPGLKAYEAVILSELPRQN